MTSELLIMTSSAVALAADSAVTVDNRKTYNGVNKLFMLSNNPPMGIMTYNLASFLNIPLETLIKEFRYKSVAFSAIDEFKKGFEEYLGELVNEYSHNQLSFDDQVNFFVKNIQADLKKYSREDFEGIINNNLKHFNFKELGNYYTEIWSKLKDYNEVFNQILSYYEINSEESLNDLKNFFIGKIFLDPYVGIVIAGFEENKLFPSSIHFKINYLYDDNFILTGIEKTEITGKEVLVKPLAQGDVIHTFLSSIDFNTQFRIMDYFRNSYAEYNDTLKTLVNEDSNITGKNKVQILKIISKMEKNAENINNSFNGFVEELKDDHSNPILLSISSLSKEELSNLAESLIKITSLKRKVQSDLETVGGPVDVAIITKGDGFIWTKRKHYFDGDLNPQFFDKNKFKS